MASAAATAAGLPDENVFDFRTWSRISQLSKETIEVLKSHQLVTRESLLRTPNASIKALPLLTTQRKVLLDNIDLLRSQRSRTRSRPPIVPDRIRHGDGTDTISIASTESTDIRYFTIDLDLVGGKRMERKRAAGRTRVTGDTPFGKLLIDLGLTDHYPMLISIRDIMVVQPIYRSVAVKITEVPIVMLKRLIMTDYRGRDMVDFSEKRAGDEDDFPEASGLSLEDAFKQMGMGEQKHDDLNPQDVLLVSISCCNLIMRQILYEKLFLCKLAIPLIYPHDAKRELLFCMFALRSLVLEWKNRGGVTMESSLVKASFNHVSFVRVGRPHMSKSKLLNDVIRDDGHNTFFHRDCAHGMTDRLVANGLVETSWFLPSGKNTDFCDRVCMLSNLRGDASDYPTQSKFLKESSCLMVVIVDVEDIARNLTTLKFLLEKPESSLCLLTTRNFPFPMDRCKASVEKLYSSLSGINGGKVNLVLAFDRQRMLNAVDLKKKLRGCIEKRSVDGGFNARTELIEMKKKALAAGMMIDESLHECEQGLKIALKIKDTTNGLPIAKVKSELLQLQGDHWLKWSELQKAKHRIKPSGSEEETSIHRIDEINNAMRKLRDEQALICQSPSKMIRALLESLTQDPDFDTIEFALRWEKLLLDDKCREVLPSLSKKYHDQWNSLRKVKAKSTPDRKQLQKLSEAVENAEKELQRSSLGLEHLFRELGQIYEASMEGNAELGHDRKLALKQLTRLCAELLLAGHTMEVMDGEASNIPVTWASGVLEGAMEIIGRNKKVFVLSVLGVQSSGKSTLLNTMFGMQFAVSAGRCTRGVYTQLVPVAKDSGLPFDYIFVDDTEGLRAPELAQTHNHDHDNELATLAIGLGDVTLVVIKGENYSELQDVLQIVVHAFLRMKIVNKNLNLNKRCVFIHQNVSATTAEEKMLQARKKLQDTLDKMTIEAAELEDRNDIKAFSDVIHFDCDTDIWYFSGLWNGDPPMACVNPGYSENVAKVYQHIIDNIACKQEHFYRLSDLIESVKDLWKGILTEDFVFSFRNCLEVRAYNILETQYYKVYWELEKSIMTWVRETAGKRIALSESEGQLSSCVISQRNDLARMISNREKIAYKEMDHFFETHELREKFLMWRQYKLNALKHAATDFSDRAKKELLKREKRRQLELLHESKNLRHEEEILRWAEELASSSKRSQLTEANIHEKFDAMWDHFLSVTGLTLSKSDVFIPDLVEKALWDVFYDNRPLLNEQLSGKKLKKPFPFEKLTNSIPINDITKYHISVPPDEAQWGRSADETWMKIQRQAFNHTNEVMKHIEAYIKDLAQNDSGFPEDSPSYVIQIVLADLKRHNEQSNKSFTFLSNFKVKLAVHCCQYAIGKFNQMADEYEKRHGAASTLQTYKEKAFKLFINTVDQRGGDIVIADLIGQSLKSMIMRSVEEEIPQLIVADVVGFFNTKYRFILAILDDMALQKKFSNFKSYLYNPKDYGKTWIRTFCDKHYFNLQGVTKYACIAQDLVQKFCECIRHSILAASKDPDLKDNPQMKTWSRIFCEHVQRELALPISSLRHIEMRQLGNVEELTELLLARVQEFEEVFNTEFSSVTAKTVRWLGESPYDQIIQKLWGCRAECSFCGEVCQFTDPNHIQENTPHRCIQHRPSGVIGWHRSTGELNFETCSYRITQDWKFRCGRETCGQRFRECARSDREKVYHPYKDYKKYISEWEIDPSQTMDSSDYWTWFMATFIDELADHYCALKPEVPASWKNITIQQARDSLRQTYMYADPVEMNTAYSNIAHF